MALRKFLAKRLIFDGRGVKSPASAPLRREYLPSPESKAIVSRRYLHRGALGVPEFLSLPIGERIRETLRGSDYALDRPSLACLSPPPAIGDSLFELSVKDAKKILRLAQMEKVKLKLREKTESSIPYAEFSRICMESCESEEQGAEFATMLDQSGNVIVLGNLVFLRPEQVARSMETIISESMEKQNDRSRAELEEMEKRKAAIDRRAGEQVKGELYCGLGLVMLQIMAAMRLTFWELSWDVMEPICFFATSVHFALGYAFFLRTSTEPTFHGYFQRRFEAKQRRLMQADGFDLRRYSRLRDSFHRPRPEGCSLGGIDGQYR